jgi:hypothetical protein
VRASGGGDSGGGAGLLREFGPEPAQQLTDTLGNGCELYSSDPALGEQCVENTLDYVNPSYDFFSVGGPLDSRPPGGGGYLVEGNVDRKVGVNLGTLQAVTLTTNNISVWRVRALPDAVRLLSLSINPAALPWGSRPGSPVAPSHQHPRTSDLAPAPSPPRNRRLSSVAVLTPHSTGGYLRLLRRQRFVAPVVVAAGFCMTIRIAPILLTLCSLLAAAAPVAAQTDFAGEWAPVRSMDNVEDPWVGDWVGLPLNDAGRARAEGWDAALLSLPEYQCRPHGWAYIYRGPTQLRISKEVDPFTRELVAYHPEWHQSTNMPVYLDGRDAPPGETLHTWGGFSQGRWEGAALRIETTHLKEDYVRRNGAMVSDQAKVTTFWIRRGDYLTWINVVHDPLYLSEPLVRSGEYRLAPNQQVPAHPCTSVFEGLEPGQVPHYLPGENSFLPDVRTRYGLSPSAPTGGADTMYPEYKKQIKDSAWTRGDKKGTAGAGGGFE